MNDSHISNNCLQYTRDSIDSIQSNVAFESPVSLTLNGQVWVTFHCSPLELEYLAVGFLFNEGFINSFTEIENIHLCSQKDNIDVWLNHAVEKPISWQRTSGCGGGSTSVEIGKDPLPPLAIEAKLDPIQIFNLMDQFMTEQPAHSEFGGVHTSALADGEKQLFQVIDIGRHNTIDKIAGRILMEPIKVQTPILITSGRISSDMVQKAVRLRAPYLISMRSASQLGITLADEFGITVIAGARRGRFNLFSHPERIRSNL